ncbi:hypothetical protein ACHAP5_011519, partial [Fusarium lateritium]
MHVDAIHAWLTTIEPTCTVPTANTDAVEKRKPSSSMSSPPKRQRHDSDSFDNDVTSRRPTNTIYRDTDTSSTAPTSIFTEILALRPHLTQPPPRSLSLSKQYKERSDLLRFDYPVRFMPVENIKAYLPPDAHGLYDALVSAEYCEAVLPLALKDVVDLPDTRPYMWNAVTDNKDTATEKHCRFQKIVELSNESSQLRRSEAAWNSHVHMPLLTSLAESQSPAVAIEDITSARIVPRFRPTFTDSIPDEASSTGSYSTNSNSNASRPTAKSVHKMVDFALVLRTHAPLAGMIEKLTKFHDATINQTAYYPLKTRPAPVFIETKIASGNGETADVQLGIWIAAWHESMRSLIKRGGLDERVITVPLIQVTEARWTVIFAVDVGSEL